MKTIKGVHLLGASFLRYLFLTECLFAPILEVSGSHGRYSYHIVIHDAVGGYRGTWGVTETYIKLMIKI